MGKSDKGVPKYQDRYSAQDSANSDTPGMSQVKDNYMSGLSVQMKDRQGRDVEDHTTTHRPPEQHIPASNDSIYSTVYENSKYRNNR